MQKRVLTIIALAGGLALTGCKTMESGNIGGLMDTGSTAMKAMSLSDSDIVTLSNESCEAMDAQSKIAPAGSKYTQRLNKVVSAMPSTINGKKAVYKVYLTNDVNAWAMANGCIRVYSGLMDLMNDDELRGVIGHEIGHVALGHSKSRMQTAYAASAARSLAANSGGALAALSRSQAGELGEKFLNAQFSQSQESAADDYSFDLLTEKKMNRQGLVTGFQKLAKLSGGSGGSSMMSSHPPSDTRAKRMQDRLDKK
ncbi:Metalloprotease LoiP [bioreactor metagenome]|uniref:Metalloprotease LoiP n=1 Tax=bioreactor metagenome TaxID=1076179 RepID=A0A645A2M9_9ZZZZ